MQAESFLLGSYVVFEPPLGEGTYGVVRRGIHTETRESVAIKRIRLDAETEGVPSTAIREIAILREFSHPNIVRLLELIINGLELHLVFELCDLDLRCYMREVSRGPVEPQYHASFLFQMLLGCAHCHARKVIHRDLKPQNVLVKLNPDRTPRAVKLADFGLARPIQMAKRPMTHEVVTLWYRPPEILLGDTGYSGKVDVWAIGCIFVEMVSKRPLFPGDSEIDTLFKIFRLRGTPTEESWPGVTELPEFRSTFPKWRDVLPERLSSLRPVLGESGCDLLIKLLVLCPKKRIDVFDALKHPYFSEDAEAFKRNKLKQIASMWGEDESEKDTEEKKEEDKLRHCPFPSSTWKATGWNMAKSRMRAAPKKKQARPPPKQVEIEAIETGTKVDSIMNNYKGREGNTLNDMEKNTLQELEGDAMEERRDMPILDRFCLLLKPEVSQIRNVMLDDVVKENPYKVDLRRGDTHFRTPAPYVQAAIEVIEGIDEFIKDM
uniref:Cyclin-dependent kinase 2 homolog n=1 Tax=Chromera velia CCMP2878 TaxID=1169474 RepID=A0A0G4F533_9ALVE|eukprot:Cvel_2773.t1-p1 / transcript=Cvel_2773.t1 / gene=Cvel_2773 / organism=Chromera_velia_CCMP2878 / gene_product=Cell division control protein 2 homolog A, putative / transcript_product=Cell division control protein 2 homolog A, putative / location=Cvel_scaffold111:86930-102745(-) / protein_length=491 / sequence_SO=supercontig / SO=protein_coding / is_pseudo=false